MTTAYRADHVGSFLRAPELLAARMAVQDPERLRALEDQHVLRVLAKQDELGFAICTDGELRRRNFMSDMTDAVEGFDLSDAVGRAWQAGQSRGAQVSSVTGIVSAKLRAMRPLTGHELPFLLAHAQHTIKVTLPSATQFPAISFKWGITNRIYRSHFDLLWAIVEIMKVELARLVSEGVGYIQIDAPRYSYFMDPKWRDWIVTEMKIQPEELLNQSLEADNACFAASVRPSPISGCCVAFAHAHVFVKKYSRFYCPFRN